MRTLDLVAESARTTAIVNVASVPKRSPFRYPGGKTWFVPLFRRWIESLPCQPTLLVEPFAGGGIIGLTAAFESLVDHVLMVERDEQIAAVWQTVLSSERRWLVNRILNFELSRESAEAELDLPARSPREQAFKTILRNRVVRGGILAQGASFVKNGENGRGIHSRWYPETLAKRIRDIQTVEQDIEFVRGDGLAVIEAKAENPCAVFFIDPPYTAGGKRAGSRLYTHSEVDHERLFKLCAKIEGDFLMTYDNAEEVKYLARRHGFQMKPLAMKNTHHAEMTELLIGRDLDWLCEAGFVREPRTRYRVKARNSQPSQREPANCA